MKRWIGRGSAGLAVVLFLMVGFAWIRSYWAADLLNVPVGGAVVWVESCRGSICVSIQRPASGAPAIAIASNRYETYPADQGRFLRVNGFMGFGHFDWVSVVNGGVLRMQITTQSYWFPHWAVMLFCALTAGPIIFYERRHQDRRTSGMCLNCGYDLRASPDRCPECGVAVPPSAAEQGIAAAV